MEKFYHPSGTSGNGKQYQLFLNIIKNRMFYPNFYFQQEIRNMNCF